MSIQTSAVLICRTCARQTDYAEKAADIECVSAGESLSSHVLPGCLPSDHT